MQVAPSILFVVESFCVDAICLLLRVASKPGQDNPLRKVTCIPLAFEMSQYGCFLLSIADEGEARVQGTALSPPSSMVLLQPLQIFRPVTDAQRGRHYRRALQIANVHATG